jgi:hypothetical protein
MRNASPRRRRIIWLMVLVLAVVGGLVTYVKFFREEPAPYFASDEDHFLFGSVGTEGEQGIPYWIWLVLPRIFPEYLPGPGGYASTGILAKDGREMPVGLSKVTIGFPRVAINCAMCHTASYRLRPDDPPTIVAAAPSHQTAPQQPTRDSHPARSSPRSPRTPGCRCSIGCSTGLRSFRARAARCGVWATPTPGCSTDPTGAVAASTRSTR